MFFPRVYLPTTNRVAIGGVSNGNETGGKRKQGCENAIVYMCLDATNFKCSIIRNGTWPKLTFISILVSLHTTRFVILIQSALVTRSRRTRLIEFCELKQMLMNDKRKKIFLHHDRSD